MLDPGSVRHTRGTFVSPRGPALRSHAWQPSESNAAAAQPNTACELFILHGYAAHGAFPTVRLLAEHLAARGFTVRSLDFEGCGESEGLPGLITDYAHLVGDALAFVDAHRVVTEKPAFILGTSAGAALALLCSTVAPPGTFAGAVVLSPLVVISEAAKPGAMAQRALRLLGAHAPACSSAAAHFLGAPLALA
jgi:alpha-beta hydrolase superfamily lysophospholipase